MPKKQLVNSAGLVVLIILLFLVPSFFKSHYMISIISLIIMNILLASTVRIIWLLDQFPMGQVGFALIGAYGSALLMMKFGLPFWVTFIAGGLMAGAFALAVGYPFLKTKGIYFAILTVMMAETLRLVTYHWRSVTGGQHGLLGIPVPAPITLPFIGTFKFDTLGHYYYIIVVVVLVSLFIIYKLEHSHLGAKWRAIRDSEALAHAIGINVTWYIMVNFAIAAFFAGISGALFAHYLQTISADFNSRFGVPMSLMLIMFMAVGGEGKFAGPIIGTIFLSFISEIARPFREYVPMILGAITILVMIYMPEGLVSLLERGKGLLKGGGPRKSWWLRLINREKL
jgi:branched-chain amino acid transport system permease protein